MIVFCTFPTDRLLINHRVISEMGYSLDAEWYEDSFGAYVILKKGPPEVPSRIADICVCP
jgi:hypothetical protein